MPPPMAPSWPRRCGPTSPGSYDVLTWVPVSPARRKERGYDQAQPLAQATAQALGTEAVSLLAKTGHNAPQSSLTQGSQRRSNVAGVYTVPSRRRWPADGCW